MLGISTPIVWRVSDVGTFKAIVIDPSFPESRFAKVRVGWGDDVTFSTSGP